MASSGADASPRCTVRLVLDGQVAEVANVDPTRTVLEFLREDCGRTGTKEGCAEGDCGACTVALGEPVGGRVRYRAVNACIQFVPTLDGTELITVENLRRADGSLHPVQQAMVDCHGSQCGFCTPGFVMSLFALYKSVDRPSREQINDAITGNLCRCTGYRPIVEAAERMYDYGSEARNADDHWMNCSFSSPGDRQPSRGEREMIERLHSIEPRDVLAITRGGRRYFAPTRLADLASLREAHPDAQILAGGTDIGLWVTKQYRDLREIIYVGNVAQLAEIALTDTHIEIGAAASLTDAFAKLVAHYPGFVELFRRFASPPIRNAGTLGGNIANGSPIGDSMPALMVLGTTLVLRMAERTRELPLDAFYVAYQKTALERGEFLERIRVPRPADNAHVRCYKISKRFDQDISAACGAYRIVVADGEVVAARVAYGGMAEIPKRASACEQALERRPWTEATVQAAMRALDSDYTPLTDMRASASYRRQVARNLLYRFWLETSGQQHAATRVDEVEA